jgi:hypothetical protein
MTASVLRGDRMRARHLTLAVSVLAVTGCKKFWNDGDEMSPERQALIERVSKQAERLSGVAEAVAGEPSTRPVSCSAADLPESPVALYAMRRKRLSELVGSEPEPREGGNVDLSAEIGSPVLSPLRPPDSYEGRFNTGGIEKALAILESAEFLAVTRQISSTEAKAHLTSFHAGSALVHMSIVRISDAKVVCETPIEVESSSSIIYEQKSVGGLSSHDEKRRQSAAARDLKEQYHPAAKAAVEALSEGKLQLRRY